MTGAEAEDLALRHLQRQGLRLVDRNVRYRGGELDLVMLDGTVLVVVEVRLRSHGAFGGAAASVDARKQRRIILATQLYLAEHAAHAQRVVRFDVVALDGGGKLDWILAAFDGF
ncbi:MAG TPA: YraN family protein [Solimonas sp.]